MSLFSVWASTPSSALARVVLVLSLIDTGEMRLVGWRHGGLGCHSEIPTQHL